METTAGRWRQVSRLTVLVMITFGTWEWEVQSATDSDYLIINYVLPSKCKMPAHALA